MQQVSPPQPARTGKHYCIVISSLGAGGAERVIAQLSSHWIKNHVRITIISFDSDDDRLYHGFPPEAEFRRLGKMPPLTKVTALRRQLKRIQPDLVISFLTKINVISLLATIRTDIPVMAAERNNPEKQDAHPIWLWALRLLYRRADAIICQTRASLRCIPQHSRDKAVVIPNPVAPPEYIAGDAIPADPKKLLAVGRLAEQKGFDLLIDAYAKIADRFPEWELDIWGEGPQRGALQKRIERSGHSPKIRLRGLSTKPGSWAAQGHAFILSSRFEGFPNVLGEAMAAGMPVIATDCDFGPSELIRHGETGLLAEPDNAQALSDAMAQIFRDDELRARLASAASQECDRFSLEKIADKWDDAAAQIFAGR